MGKKNHEFGMISFADLDPIRKENGRTKYIDNKYHFLGGSPDGISVDVNITECSVLSQVEVKCPMRRKIKHGQIPTYYFPQVQLNMFILDLDYTDFIEYIPKANGKDLELNMVKIYRDEDWFDKNVPILQKFWDEVLLWRTKDITTHPEYDKYYKVPKILTSPPYLFMEDSLEERPLTPLNEDVCLFEDD